jgi:N-lysine methyltransferase SETD6
VIQDLADQPPVALQDLAEDEELFAIPRSLVLAASASSIPPEVLSGLDEHGSWPPLIVTIVYEYLKGPESNWFPYFQVLPSTFDSLMFWSAEELAHLQASAVVRKIGKASAETSWEETIVPRMLEHGNYFPVPGTDDIIRTAKLIELAHMAGSLIMAYAFDIDRDEDVSKSEQDEEFEEDDEDEPLKGMVPFADMLNADADRNNARLFQEDDYLIMNTTKPIQTGEQIFNDYGPLPRSDLLRMYGYVTANYAQYDVVEFEHDLLVNAAGMQDPGRNADWLRREEQLEEIGIIDDGYAFPRPQADESIEDAVPGNIHMLLRALTTDPKVTKPSKMKDEPLSIEEAALLSAVAVKKLSEYSTSLEEDQAILQDLKDGSDQRTQGKMSLHRYRSAVQVRAGEKEILGSLINLCQTHIVTKTNDIASNDKKRKHDTDSTTSRKSAKRMDQDEKIWSYVPI